jgi:hypothetical protein
MKPLIIKLTHSTGNVPIFVNADAIQIFGDIARDFGSGAWITFRDGTKLDVKESANAIFQLITVLK